MNAPRKEAKEAKFLPCFRCDSMLPFFKMMESWRPEHAWNAGELTFDEEGTICGERGQRICP
eukprot:2591847-Prorocentrum_lima.AAC.1